jgi:YNFM family putative membrane transporter
MGFGAILTLPDSIICIVAGIALFTCGFFGIHSIASGWVSRRATTYRAQATSIYLFSYYLGSSISGTLGGFFWITYGWPGISLMICLLLAAALVFTEFLQSSYSEKSA